MAKFMLKCFMLLSVLLFGVLLGMEQANNGMIKMKGYNDHSFKGAFHIDQNDVGGLEAAFLGQTITAHDLKKKKEKLQQIKTFNFFSAAGAQLAEFVSKIFYTIISFFVTMIDKILLVIYL